MGILNLPPLTSIKIFKLLDNVSTVSESEIIKSSFANKAFQINIDGVATVGVLQSNDGVIFNLLFPPISVSNIINNDSPAIFYKAKIYSIVPGSLVSVILAEEI